MHPLRRIAALWVTCLLLVGVAHAQGIGRATEYVEWTTTSAPEVVAPGEEVQVRLHASIADGWKMYALDSPPPTRGVQVDVEKVPEGFTQQGALTQSEPKEGYDPNFGKDVRYFTGEAVFTAAFAVGETVAPGTYEMGGTVTFQICTDRLCLPPTPVPFSVDIRVGTGVSGGPALTGEVKEEQRTTTLADTTSPAGALASEVGDTSSAQRATAPSLNDAPEAGLPAARGSEAGGGGWWAFVLLAAGAGLAALLTPCVFPMIPLTVSYFTRHGEHRGESVRMALVYGGTIVLTFTGLGVLTAVVVGAAGAQVIAANPWVNLFLGVVFVVFALSLLGLFELRLPSGLLNYFNRQSNERVGYTGVFFMGLTLTLVSFSCTAPFVGGLLAATAQGSWSTPVLGMIVFSAVFALPFMLFALFPNGLAALPKSGAWMHTIKVVLGFIELAAALKFLSNADLVWGTGLISRPLAIAVTSVLFFLTGLFLLGKLRLKHGGKAPEAIGVVRLLAAVVFFGASLYLLPGLFGAPLGALDAYLPPRTPGRVSLLSARAGGTEAPSAETLNWNTDDIDTAFAQAEAVGKPVFIDFTGYTCTNCRAMEANVFPEPTVARRLREDFVLLRLYTDDPEVGRRFQRYQLKLTGTVALPTYAIVHPETREVLRQVSGMTEAHRFVAFLDSGSAAFAAKDHLAMR